MSQSRVETTKEYLEEQKNIKDVKSQARAKRPKQEPESGFMISRLLILLPPIDVENDKDASLPLVELENLKQ